MKHLSIFGCSVDENSNQFLEFTNGTRDIMHIQALFECTTYLQDVYISMKTSTARSELICERRTMLKFSSSMQPHIVGTTKFENSNMSVYKRFINMILGNSPSLGAVRYVYVTWE